MCAGGVPPPLPAVKEAREDQKVIQYIDSCIKKANESSVSRAAKIQVGRDPAWPTHNFNINSGSNVFIIRRFHCKNVWQSKQLPVCLM